MPKLNKCACGGNAELVEGEYASFQTGYAVYCTKCHIKLGVTGRLGEAYEWMTTFDTKEAAVDAWNEIMRGQTTCHIEEAEFEFIGSDDHKKGIARCYVCSECQDMIEQDDNYCPNCGAKVV